MRKSLLLSLLASTMLSSVHAQLDAAEKKAMTYVTDHMDATMQLLIRSVNINSGTLNIAGVHQVGDLYAMELQKLGFIIE